MCSHNRLGKRCWVREVNTKASYNFSQKRSPPFCPSTNSPTQKNTSFYPFPKSSATEDETRVQKKIDVKFLLIDIPSWTKARMKKEGENLTTSDGENTSHWAERKAPAQAHLRVLAFAWPKDSGFPKHSGMGDSKAPTTTVQQWWNQPKSEITTEHVF